MAIRITGMNSGLDTESIITELVKAQKTKVDTLKKAQTRVEWKQDAWKELNSKITKLYNGSLSDMRYESDYSKKATKVTNSNAVSVITDASAVNGVQSLQIDKLAKTGYLTGAKLSGSNTAATTLSTLGITSSSTLKITSGGKDTEIAINGDTTIGELVESLQGAGLNASFDTKNQRFFVSAKDSGAASDFTLAFSDENAKMQLGFGTSMTADQLQSYVDSYAYSDSDVTAKAAETAQSYLEKITASEAAIAEAEASRQKLIDEDGYDSSKTASDLEQAIKDLDKDDTLTEEEKATRKTELEKQLALAKKYETFGTAITTENANIAKFNEYITVTDNPDGTKSAAATAKLTDEVRTDFADALAYAQSVAANYGTSGYTNYATKIDGQDAIIRLNGAEFTSKNNIFDINGLTITAQQETGGDVVTLTTADDTDGIYDKIKSFLKDYNTLINEMDKLYNADSAKDYEPLTDEEKEEMSDTEVEKWEEKIKDSILRRDDTLSTVSEAMKEIMMDGVTVGDKKYYLSDFGIETLGYFNSADNEKNAYHIAGDPDDESTKNSQDLLKSAIANAPETTVSFFTGLSKNLWGKLNELMTKTDYSSSFTVYEDVKMKEDYDAYTEKINNQEDKVTALEDKWYAKFSAMETALAKLQSNQSAVTSLLGG